LLVLLLIPPYVSITRYKNRIAALMSRSLGRSVRLSSVELRLLPRPAFLMTDLTVEEDPAYGAEPVLHANAVVASVRLVALWRGRLELSRISVDEASLNLVRNNEGRWNLDSVFRAASSPSGQPSETVSLPPYLEATNSRINVKKGIEKLPYSLVNADFSFWEENAGDWRIRLRGQPARTDVSLDLADTGIVRLEGRLHRASALDQMPLHLELDWRSAQLGQLSRLVLGRDPGWRGDLTGQVQVDGTAATAIVKTRLSAVGVHRAEFAPSEALDFDANCNFTYYYFDRSVERLSCDSPLGDGHIMLTGELPGDRPARLTVEAQRVPASAGLDALRTLRSGLNSDLEASGTVSGRITYDPASADTDTVQETPASGRMPRRRGSSNLAPGQLTGPFSGSFLVEGFRLSGGGLTQAIVVSKPPTLQPARTVVGQPDALGATISIPAGGSSPLVLVLQLAAAGYQATVRGPASLARIREFAHVAGLTDLTAFDGLAGDPATLDLMAEGPWLPAPKAPGPAANSPMNSLGSALALRDSDSDRLAGTVTLHSANWKADALGSHVEISQAVLHLGGSAIVWDPVEFSYGPVKGTASFQPAPTECPIATECVPQLDLSFSALDTPQLQAAMLGAKQQSTGISALIERFSASSAAAWPRLNATVHADTLQIGPVAVAHAAITLKTKPSEVEFVSFGGELFGGILSGTGKLTKGDKPAYVFDGQLAKASPLGSCRLFSLRCAGGPIDAHGHVELSGFTDRDLASSAKGTLHFEWRRGSLQQSIGDETAIPKVLAHFDHWSGDATIGDNGASLSASEVGQGWRKVGVDATVTFADQPSIGFSASKALTAEKH
jgi:hypothetical protein